MATVAYAGVPGAFAEQACRAFLPDHDWIGVGSFAAVAAAVAQGECELGMLPRENSIAGPVPGVAELIAQHRLAVLSTHDLPVRQHLMAKPGVALGELRVAASHPMALAQCTLMLEELGLAAEEAVNTAVAAQALAESEDRGRAVIASEAAAKAWGLTILRYDVHDRKDNFTTFCIVARPGGGAP
jgi:prephenate dehydratase